jgi:predicted lipid-binding transport protein (Tim44 family)
VCHHVFFDFFGTLVANSVGVSARPLRGRTPSAPAEPTRPSRPRHVPVAAQAVAGGVAGDNVVPYPAAEPSSSLSVADAASAASRAASAAAATAR